MAQFSITLTGAWSDLYTLTGVSTERPLLIYADGGNIAVALSASEPGNLAYGAEAYQGEQLTAGGDGDKRVYARATSGGRAIIKVQDEESGAVRKGSMGKVVDILDRVEVKDIASLRTVNENATQFGEDLVAVRTPIIELNSSYGTSALRDDIETTGSGAVSDGSGTITVSSGATASSTATLESAEIGRYIPGYGAQLGLGVEVPTSPTGNQEVRWGGRGADDQNEVGFGVDSGGVFVFLVRDGVETFKTYQTDWNLDKLDGNGQSDVTLDTTVGNIYQIEFTWYGYGEILFGVIAQTVGADGRRKQRFLPCHQYRPTGGTSLTSPNLRVCCRVDNGGDAADITANVGGRQYSIVGQYVPKTRLSAEFRGSTSTSTTFIPLVSARRKSAFSDRSIKLNALKAIAGNSPHLLQVRIGGVLTGATFANPTGHVADETALEYDKSATAITGGVPIASALVPASAPSQQALGNELSDIDVPNGDIVTLCVRTVSGTSTIAASLLEMREEW